MEPSTPPFLRLPAELKNEIYKLAFAETTETFKVWGASNQTHPLCQVNRETRAECTQLFYSLNIFSLSPVHRGFQWLHQVNASPCAKAVTTVTFQLINWDSKEGANAKVALNTKEEEPVVEFWLRKGDGFGGLIVRQVRGCIYQAWRNMDKTRNLDGLVICDALKNLVATREWYVDSDMDGTSEREWELDFSITKNGKPYRREID
ncbi:hypothetical protein K402DRAFT_455318 [Aulographum hederae CBS 113979]|uniref:F-box domain-containing protein n=1 Tax=Aulographum hederae CBS 113979 TaxID=1176131 RepID=A0A6G1GVN7_9PEZI|nr:hypothetical protein K402DRAFT_455318 [Aulographum hederae CBS 113979]